MIDNREAAQEAVEVLNRIHQADPTVLPALIAFRVPCNEALTQDPTVQVHGQTRDGPFQVGILGIINGMFGKHPDGWGWIFADYDDAGALVGFRVFDE